VNEKEKIQKKKKKKKKKERKNPPSSSSCTSHFPPVSCKPHKSSSFKPTCIKVFPQSKFSHLLKISFGWMI